jgi:biotin--protein ligase
MFTIQLSIPLNSNIGQKLSFVQHLAALSIVKGIKTISGYEELDIRVKWPNDVYCNKTKPKLSGILVTSILYNNKVNILIGCGINVYNSRPTLCLNDIIDNYNIQSLTKKLNHLKCEEVIARTLTQLEILLSTIEEHNGIEIIKDLYRKHWMHSSQSIKLIDNNMERLVTIEGLDNEGYLQVRDNSNGLVLSLHPDGNRFDIMHNLIVSAKH